MELKLPDMSCIESVTLKQEPDSCEDRESEYQRLTVFLDDAGGGYFARLSSERWAIDDPDAFAEMLKQLTEQADDWEKKASERHFGGQA
jgi:hypothetical protein